MSGQIIDISDAAVNLKQLVNRAATGKAILIGTEGGPVARLVAADSRTHSERRIGLLAGKPRAPDDFDEDLPPDVLDAFGGRQGAAARPGGQHCKR